MAVLSRASPPRLLLTPEAPPSALDADRVRELVTAIPMPLAAAPVDQATLPFDSRKVLYIDSSATTAAAVVGAFAERERVCEVAASAFGALQAAFTRPHAYSTVLIHQRSEADDLLDLARMLRSYLEFPGRIVAVIAPEAANARPFAKVADLVLPELSVALNLLLRADVVLPCRDGDAGAGREEPAASRAAETR